MLSPTSRVLPAAKSMKNVFGRHAALAPRVALLNIYLVETHIFRGRESHPRQWGKDARTFLSVVVFAVNSLLCVFVLHIVSMMLFTSIEGR